MFLYKCLYGCKTLFPMNNDQVGCPGWTKYVSVICRRACLGSEKHQIGKENLNVLVPHQVLDEVN